jgi:hypothetical protein
MKKVALVTKAASTLRLSIGHRESIALALALFFLLNPVRS